MALERLFSVEEAALQLGGLSKYTIHAWLSSGKLRRTKVGSRTMIRESELQRVIDDLGEWGARWAFGDPRPNELDPVILLWWMRRHVCHEHIPRPRVVIQFDFGGPRRRYWLVVESKDVSVCLRHPGFEVDVLVTADIRAFYRVFLGRCAWSEVLHAGQVQLEGTPADTRAFARWFSHSPMANAVRAALTAGQ